VHRRRSRRQSAVEPVSPKTSPTSSLLIELLPIGSLAPHSKNPRQHSDRQIKQIARSIETFGFNVPILIDRNGTVLAGHGRLLAGRKLDWTTVPTIRLEHLTEAQAKAFMIADNRLAETSVWDDRLLAEALRDLSELELNFSIEDTGFEVGEIDFRIESLEEKSHEQDDRGDALPPFAEEAVSQAEDLWLLGHHRVYCGNALDSRAYEVLMAGERAGMVFSDPPYNVRVDGHASGLGRVHHREFAMASGEMGVAEYTSFLTIAYGMLARHSVDGSIHFICSDWAHAAEVMAAGTTAYSEFKNICIWVKHNPGMGSLYRGQHEFVFVFKAGRGRHRNNIQLGQFGRNRSNVWFYPGANSFGRSTEEGNMLALHPTVKPVKMVADAILDCSVPGDIVLDGFLGSGTTLIAAERVRRRCYGLEIDPLYVDAIVRRWQNYTGGSAVHARTGIHFDNAHAKDEAGNG
jgi:DNA modification methylase